MANVWWPTWWLIHTHTHSLSVFLNGGQVLIRRGELTDSPAKTAPALLSRFPNFVSHSPLPSIFPSLSLRLSASFLSLSLFSCPLSLHRFLSVALSLPFFISNSNSWHKVKQQKPSLIKLGFCFHICACSSISYDNTELTEVIVEDVTTKRSNCARNTSSHMIK